MSGFLLCDLTIRETAFVPLVEQIDFSDYRDAGGVKVRSSSESRTRRLMTKRRGGSGK